MRARMTQIDRDDGHSSPRSPLRARALSRPCVIDSGELCERESTVDSGAFEARHPEGKADACVGPALPKLDVAAQRSSHELRSRSIAERPKVA